MKDVKPFILSAPGVEMHVLSLIGDPAVELVQLDCEAVAKEFLGSSVFESKLNIQAFIGFLFLADNVF